VVVCGVVPVVSCGVVLFLSCVVWCYSCCVFVCVTCSYSQVGFSFMAGPLLALLLVLSSCVSVCV